jgi:hypothetical protein
LATVLQHQWARKLLSFDFMVDYKRGAMNIVVDALSRCDMKEDAAPYTLSAPTFLLFDDQHQEFNVSADLGRLMEEVTVGSHSAR